MLLYDLIVSNDKIIRIELVAAVYSNIYLASCTNLHVKLEEFIIFYLLFLSTLVRYESFMLVSVLGEKSPGKGPRSGKSTDLNTERTRTKKTPRDITTFPYNRQFNYLSKRIYFGLHLKYEPTPGSTMSSSRHQLNSPENCAGFCI